MNDSVLAVIAGQGDLPLKIIAEQKQYRRIVIIAFEGQTPLSIVESTHNEFPILWTKLGLISPTLDFFKKHNVCDITMAGGMMRPRIRDLSVDFMGARWLKTLGMNAFKGDDHLLKGLVALLEKDGYKVVPAHSLVGNLFVRKGVLTKIGPTDTDLTDIAHGKDILDALSCYDVGQSIVVHDGCVLGIEAIGGTEVLLSHVKAFDRVQGGVFIKMPKKGQSTTVDMPTIGMQTIVQVIGADLSGIAIEAGGVQVLDLDEVIQAADEAGVFLVGI